MLLFMLTVVTLCKIRGSGGAYFSMSNMEMQIPADKSKYPPSNHILTALYALPDTDFQPDNFRFSFHSRKNAHLQIFPAGDLMFTRSFLQDNAIDELITGISVEDSSGKKDNTTFRVKLSSAGADCDLWDLCYWRSVNYRIFENRKSSTVGTLSSPYLQDVCPNYRISYIVFPRDDRIELVAPTVAGDHKSWLIRTRKPLDRDIYRGRDKNRSIDSAAGQYVNFTVQCRVEGVESVDEKILSRIVTLKVLDENDNGPTRQTKGDIHVIHDGFVRANEAVQSEYEAIEKKLIFIDRDSPAVNDHQVQILKDHLGLFKVNCTEFEDDREGEPQTVKFCKLIYARNANIKDTKYSVILQINDTTMLPGYGDSHVQVPIHMIHQDHHEAKTLTASRKFQPLKLYPKRNFSIFRSAAPLARVTNPKLPLHSSNISNFSIVYVDSEEASQRPFAVTESDGIVYVASIKTLRKSHPSYAVDIQWTNNGVIESDQLVIGIIEEPSDATCQHFNDDSQGWSLCAENSKPGDCYKACAVGSGGSASVALRKEKGGPKRCLWRGDATPGTVVSDLYSTCTPDIESCPDGICDSLEEKHPHLCPQDCTRHVTFPNKLNPKTHRGILAASGVCTCSRISDCVCNDQKPSKREKGLRKQRNNGTASVISTLENETLDILDISSLSRHTGIELASCGTPCLLGLLAAGIFLVAAIIAAIACWKLDKVHKVRGKFSGDGHNDLLSAPLSDYVDRGLMPENNAVNAINVNFDMTTSLNQITINRKSIIDPKWEFPRSQLFIEQTLGEGEFGRVLRARAKDIAGQIGFKTVAVKTLKEDARDAELEDLLSEYNLLKEVSHPNIIRLLGASTTPGGPVYLIIEYAQLGSLRSYLRRSRHLKSESQLPRSSRLEDDADNYDEPKTNSKVTPKDILSFAWQIANGMSYLSDIKLVHRDLAARNVLLDADKVCKISDFGLTRDIYEDDAYFKRSKGRVPVKWMAPESLSDHVYTSKSDVWSFGILVWELVTLGATPYPGIQVQNLYHLLKTGYRMERPENCSLTLYKIMKSCWHIDPEQRPTFSDLVSKWETMLGDQVEYLDLTPNAIHNRSYFCTLDEQEDNEDNEESACLNYNLQQNLQRDEETPKCSDSQKLLEPENVINAELRDVEVQGYETPVKVKGTQHADKLLSSGNNVQYYTNMDAGKKIMV